MDILKNLTPAETYLIKYHSNSTFKELLKLTFADLCLKKVLKIEERDNWEKPEKKAVKYVLIGENFQVYKAKFHETAFLSIFQRSPEMALLFKQMIAVAQVNAKSKGKYVHKAFLENPQFANNFKRNFLTRLGEDIILSKEGRKLKEKIDNILERLSAELPAIIRSDKEKATGILNEIGGNVFLIEGLELELFREFDQGIDTIKEKRGVDPGIGCGGCFTSYTDNAEDFDTAYTGLDSPIFGDGSGNDSACSSDTGTGGDSGCSSGCSGCSGSE